MQHKHYLYIALAVVIIGIIGFMVFRSSSGNTDIIEPNGPVVPDSGRKMSGGTLSLYDYTEAPKHIGENVSIQGTVLKVFTTKSGVTFLDYCKTSNNCPFSAVIFASDVKKFGDLSKIKGTVTVTGIIKSYQQKAEIILSDPEQIIM